MKYAIIGTGAIGGYYGGRLAHAGQEVHFLAHSDYDVMKQALTIDSCNGSFVLTHPNVYRSTAQMPQVDVVIVALKTINNGLLPSLLKPLLHADTVVVLIQNGLCVEEDLAQKIEGIQLVAGLGFICCTKVGPAHVVHQDYGALTLANYSCKDDLKVNAIANELNLADVATDIVEYNFGRWRKAIWNLPFNGLCVTKQTDTMQLVTHPDSLATVRDIMAEVVAIANALGVAELGEADIDKQVDNTLHMKAYLPSMRVDFDNHRPMEVFYLYTRAIMEANRLGVPCPKLKKLESELVKINGTCGMSPYAEGSKQ